MKNLLFYLVLAVIVGGAVPIILSYLTKKNSNRNKRDYPNH